MNGKRIRGTKTKSNANQWSILEKGLTEIYSKNASPLSFEELYRSAYEMVLQKLDDVLYDSVKSFIAKFLGEQVSLLTLDSFQGSLFLHKLQTVWDDHLITLSMTRNILMYMDRTRAKTLGLSTTYELGLDLFHDIVLLSNHIGPLLMDTLLSQISGERNGDMMDRMLFRSIIQMTISLPTGAGDTSKNAISFYKKTFEPLFFQGTRAFYKLESQVLEKGNVSSYLALVQSRLEEEKARIQQYLCPTSESTLIGIVLEELLTNHLTTILNMERTGLVAIIENKQYDDLSLLFFLFKLVERGPAELKKCLTDYIKTLGKNINEAEKNPRGSVTDHGNGEDTTKESKEGDVPRLVKETSSSRLASPLLWVESMIQMKEPFDYLLKHCFQTDSSFEIEFNTTFQFIVNQQAKAAEYISLFMDDNLKKGLKSKTDAEVEIVLDKCIDIFRFIDEKDTFERYYKSHLARRLLNGKSLSEDAEKSVIAKLKIECGQQFTKKLEGMFTDIQLSNDLSTHFKAMINESSPHLPDVFIHTLTYTNWPVFSSHPISSFPEPIHELALLYERFYRDQHSGRTLTWQFTMGTVDLKVAFDKGKKEINVATYGALVLLNVFQLESGSVGFTTIQEKTEIPEPDLKRTLQSLSVGKYKILVKSSKGRDVSTSDFFAFNSSFTCPLSKIKIPSILSSSSTGNTMETDSERQETLAKVDHERRLQMEACIVRIMKSRQKMDHSPLVAEVIAQLSNRFTPVPAVIKRCIEVLIEREFLKRDGTNHNVYLYIA